MFHLYWVIAQTSLQNHQAPRRKKEEAVLTALTAPFVESTLRMAQSTRYSWVQQYVPGRARYFCD